MIRNVVLVRLKSGADPQAFAEILASLEALRTPGMQGIRARPDAGLREGNWDGAVVADFEDASAYQEYDRDEEHNRLRQRLGALVDTIARCQLEV
jgi:hypothetical protein